MSWIGGTRSTGFRVFWYPNGMSKTPDGKRVSPKASRSFHVKSEAAQWQADFDKMHITSRDRSGQLVSSSPIKTALQRFVARGGVNGKASECYRNEILDTITRMAEMMKWTTVAAITFDEVDKWMTKKGGRGIQKPLMILKGFLDYCKKIKIGVDQDVIDMDIPKATSKPPADLMPDALAVRALLGTYAEHFPTGVALEHEGIHACRPADIRRADVRDWDSANRRITMRGTKGDKTIRKMVHKDHAQKLDLICEGRGPDEPLFLDPWGRRWTRSRHGCTGISSWYRHHIAKVHLKDSKEWWAVYHLKRWAATRLTDAAGGDIRAGMTVSGHSSVESYMRYNRTTSARQQTVLDNVVIPAELIAIQTPADAAAIQLPKSEKFRRRRLPKNLAVRQHTDYIHASS